jgi:DNA-binding MarR family transcriptional regulator
MCRATAEAIDRARKRHNLNVWQVSVLHVLTNVSDVRGRSFLKQAELAERAGMSVRQLQRALGVLEDADLLTRRAKYVRNRRCSDRITLAKCLYAPQSARKRIRANHRPYMTDSRSVISRRTHTEEEICSDNTYAEPHDQQSSRARKREKVKASIVGKRGLPKQWQPMKETGASLSVPVLEHLEVHSSATVSELVTMLGCTPAQLEDSLDRRVKMGTLRKRGNKYILATADQRGFAVTDDEQTPRCPRCNRDMRWRRDTETWVCDCRRRRAF